MPARIKTLRAFIHTVGCYLCNAWLFLSHWRAVSFDCAFQLKIMQHLSRFRIDESMEPELNYRTKRSRDSSTDSNIPENVQRKFKRLLGKFDCSRL